MRFRKGGSKMLTEKMNLRLQISLTNFKVEPASNALAEALFSDVISAKTVRPGFGLACIYKHGSFVRVIITHPNANENLVYMPQTDIADVFFRFLDNTRVQNLTEQIDQFWPLGEDSLYEVLGNLEEYLAEITRDNDSPYRPLLPAWKIYHSYKP